MRIKRQLAPTPAPTYGAITHRGARSNGKVAQSVQIVRTSPRLIVLKRAWRAAGKSWQGQRLSFDDWYQKVAEFQRSEGHEVR